MIQTCILEKLRDGGCKGWHLAGILGSCGTCLAPSGRVTGNDLQTNQFLILLSFLEIFWKMRLPKIWGPKPTPTVLGTPDHPHFFTVRKAATMRGGASTFILHLHQHITGSKESLWLYTDLEIVVNNCSPRKTLETPFSSFYYGIN